VTQLMHRHPRGVPPGQCFTETPMPLLKSTPAGPGSVNISVRPSGGYIPHPALRRWTHEAAVYRTFLDPLGHKNGHIQLLLDGNDRLEETVTN